MFAYQWKLVRYNSGWIALDRFAGVAAMDTVFDTRSEAVLGACFEMAILRATLGAYGVQVTRT